MSPLEHVFADDDTLLAITAYMGIRTALVNPDNMGRAALLALTVRVLRAAEKYPDNHETPAVNAANNVLRSYAVYLTTVIAEDGA